MARPTITVEKFLEHCKEVHCDKYDYSRINYKGISEKIEIICTDHGVFEQRAANHYNGVGCPECGYDKIKQAERKTKHEQKLKTDFFTAVRKEHKNRYTYDEDGFLLPISPLKITCKKHGVFIIPGTHHREGRGCTKCELEKAENENTN